jgi:hypothetical protein
MKKNVITINKVSYPCRLTIGAMVNYKRATGEDFSKFSGDDMEKLSIVVFEAVKSTCRADGVTFPYKSHEDIMDYIDMDQATTILGVQADEKENTEAKKN